MKVKTDPSPLYQHATTSFYLAAEDTRSLAQDIAPRITGEYAKSIKMWRRKRAHGPTAKIGSRLPQGGPLERGGWTKRGRGVHIKRAEAPGRLKEAGDQFPRLFEQRLRSTAIRASSVVDVGHGAFYERTPSSLDLGLSL